MRRAGFRGYLGLLILKILSESPMHAYGILKRLREITGHEELSVGVLYPVLRILINKGLVDIRIDRIDGEERKVYYVTDKGKKLLEERASSVDEALRVAKRFKILKSIEAERVFRIMRNLFEIADSLSEDKCEKLRRLFRSFEEDVNRIVGE